jgi:biopolymer transport protein ExbB/TolQ
MKIDDLFVSSQRQLPKLIWSRCDIEQRLGFKGLPFTRVRGSLTCVIAAVLTVTTYLLLIVSGKNVLHDMFLERGYTPYVMMFFSYWAFTVLLFKSSKLKLQRRALELEVVPEEMDFVLSVATVQSVLRRLYDVCDDPRRFLVLNRIQVALSNLRNLGRVTDVGEILRARAEHDESIVETSYNLVRSLVWAIPILGFIGTVEGLSVAIGGFGRVLSETQEPAELIEALKGVTGGLATAFETTLVALIAALIIQMSISMLKKQEEEFLNDCDEYCHQHIINRLRLNSLETGAA